MPFAFDRPYNDFLLVMRCLVQFSETLSLICQNLKRSRDAEHIPFGGNLLRIRLYWSRPIYTPDLKFLALAIPADI